MEDFQPALGTGEQEWEADMKIFYGGGHWTK